MTVSNIPQVSVHSPESSLVVAATHRSAILLGENSVESVVSPAAASNPLGVTPLYGSIMGALRVRAVSILKGHYYEKEAATQPSRAKLSRLAQEFVDCTAGLPCDASNAVFVCVDHHRCDVVRVLITGVEATPYAAGCFIFDVFCPPTYPAIPPPVHLLTTGAGCVRFNPNLYR